MLVRSMSKINVEVVRISALEEHPGADRLEIATVLGATCCVPKGRFAVGELVLWFPPDLLLPETVSEALGVKQYLRSSVYPGDSTRTNCRVAATRLRGVPSFGFIASIKDATKAQVKSSARPFVLFNDIDLEPEEGEIVDDFFGAVKYEPPADGAAAVGRTNGDAAPDHVAFHRYTDIQHLYKYAQVIHPGEEVVITEKLHGANIRLGLINVGDEFQLMVGSNRVNWKPEDANGNVPVWWHQMTKEVVNLLHDLCDSASNVVMFGELFGPGVQDMDYGLVERSLRVFDISIDGSYLDWDAVRWFCQKHGVGTVPELYRGPFSRRIIEELTDGPTSFPGVKAKFKGREGVVVKPLKERYEHHGRVIFKSVSADYLSRRNPQDN